MKIAIEIVDKIAEWTKNPICASLLDDAEAKELIAEYISAKLEPVRDILEKIKSCEAPFKRDKFEFANSVIDTHVALAEKALALMGEEE